MAREMGTPRHVQNRRRRTREGPENACVQTPLVHGWHTQGEKDELTSSCGTVQSAWQKPPVRRKGGRAGLPGRVSGRGKAGENGQNSGEMGGSSPWTGPSAPDCGDTIKALAGDQRPI